MALVATRTYPIDVDTAFAEVLPMPLSRLFRHRFGPIPPIAGTDETATWGRPGEERTVILAGRGSGTMREALVAVDAPRAFSYRLTELTGPLAALAERIDGRWQFAPAGTGTRITWTWDVAYRPAGRLARPVFERAWAGYARLALAEIETYLVGD